MSHRSIRRYLNALSWNKIKNKHFQVASIKNRLERIVALAFNDKIFNSIFIDESTVEATKNAH